jgi:outer membrane receptor protein involved in Fe transport
VGTFARAEVTPTDTLTIVGSVRGDRWALDPNTSAPSRDATQLSPKAGVSWRASSTVVVHALATHAFRAPTLNELFRNFRVGNTVTNANADLRPETLTGVEGGAAVTFGSSAELRITGFWNHLDDAVTNLTISSTPVLITRMRANAGTIRAAGADIQTEWQVARAIRASVGLEFVDSVYAASQEPGLTGNRVPQVPRVQGSAGVRIDAPASIVATAQVRVISSQYDDDRNQFLLGSATIVDLLATRPMGHGVQLFGAIENLFNDEYDVALTPTRNIGLPRTARIGVRAYLGR